jgi:hypothetical protein
MDVVEMLNSYVPWFAIVTFTTVSYTMNTIITVLTSTILTLLLANCVQLDFIVNCKTVGSNKNIKENIEAPDKSWSVTIANQDTYELSLLKKVVEKFGIPQFIQFHERLLLSSILYIFSSIPWQFMWYH